MSENILGQTIGNNPEHLPSPNHYTPQKPTQNQIKIVFTKSLRKTFVDRAVEKSPGPGQYETNKDANQSSISSNKQTKNRTFTSRFQQKSQVKPGPGAYDIKNDFKKTLPSFSLRSKTKTFQQIQISRNSFKQAPGAYDIGQKQSQTSPIISIPKQRRLVHKQDKLPGPGRYQTNQNFYSQRSFGKRHLSRSERKISFEMKNFSPGPGKYLFETSFENNKRKQKGFSCRKRFTDNSKRAEFPGPGNYQTRSDISYRSVESCKMPKAQRNSKNFMNTYSTVTPGPGKYQNLTQTYNTLNFKSRSAPKFSKAKLEKISAIKLDTTDKFYDAKINIVKKSSSSYSIGAEKRKSLFEKMGKLPGPAQYNHHEVKAVKQTVLASKFPQALRSNPLLNKLPVGPGEYFNSQSSSAFSKTGTKFSKGQRSTDFSHLQNQAKSIMRISNSSNVRNLGPIIKR